MDVAGILTMWRSLLLSLFCLPPPSSHVYSAILLLPSDLGLPSQEQTPLPSEDDPYDPGVEEGRSYYGGSTDGVVKEAVECVPDHSQVHDIGNVHRQPSEHNRGGRCPPSPDELMKEACDVCMCWSDSQCGPDQKCCYNGCMQTCLHKVKPPPVLDWLIDPTKRPILAIDDAWLIPGPEMGDPAESCSTSVQSAGESPLRCPTGYQCAIEDNGDSENGIPNRGICVRE